MSITVHNRLLRVRDCVGEGKASAILQDTLELPGEYPEVERVIAAHAVPRHVEAEAAEGRAVIRGEIDLRLLYAAVRPHEERRGRHHGERGRHDRHDEYDDHDHDGHHDHDHDDHDDHDKHDGHDGEHDKHEDYDRPRLVLADFKRICPFEVSIPVPGASPGDSVDPMVVVESVNCSLVNRRRLGVDVAIVSGVCIHEDQEVRAAVGATVVPPERVRCVKESVHVEHLAGEATCPIRLEMSLAVPLEEPAIEDVLWVIPTCRHLMGRAGEGKVTVEGAVDLDAVYLTCNPELPVHSFRWTDADHLALTVDLLEARPGMMAMVDLNILDLTAVREGDRVLTVTLDGQLKIHVHQVMDLSLVTDAVSETGEQLDVVKRTVRFPEHLPEAHHEMTAGGVLSLPPTKPPAECILWTGAVYIPDQVIVENDRVLVEGDLSLRLLYLGADDMVHHADFPRALRLSHGVDVPGARPGMMAHAEVCVQACAVRLIDPETLQVDVVVKIHVMTMRSVQIEVVIECVVVAPCPPGTTLRIVVVQPGDTLWNLSRRYGVSLDAIIRANPQIPNPDLIYPGQKVRIPCAPLGLAEARG